MKHLYFILFILCPFNNSKGQISLSSINDFEDGTTMGWQVGVAGVQPVNVPTGGPNGADDNYLSTTSTGGAGANNRLVIFNTGSTWNGNWTTAGVIFISFMARNPGGTDLTLRISLDGAGGRISSTNGIALAAGSGWTRINIPVSVADFSLVGGSDIAATLSGVSVMRILHCALPSWQGDIIAAALDIDVIQAAAGPLPVSLEYFTVATDKFKTTISWKTLTELNSHHFEVERSENGINWEVLEKVAAAGNSTLPLLYKTIDLFPYKGVSYYRLKQVDIDNRYKYSAVRLVVFNGSGENTLTVYPNPAWSSAILAERSAIDIASIYITNVSGQIVNYRVKITGLSAYKVRMDLSQLPGGVYYIKTKNGSSSLFINRE